MSNLVKHAEYELERIGLKPDAEDPMDRLMYTSVMDVVKIFSGQGHSGGSAAYAIALIAKLLKYQPVGPLLGTDDEWVEMDEKMAGRKLWQNKRCAGRVIKEADGTCYDLEGIIFEDPDGSTWTNRDSWVKIEKFPYALKTEYVKRSDEQ